MTYPSQYTPPEMQERMKRYAQSKPSGFHEYHLRQNYRDLCLIYGKEAARELLNEIADTTEERMK